MEGGAALEAEANLPGPTEYPTPKWAASVMC